MADVELLPCLKCGCGTELSLDSSIAAEASWIECGWCGYKYRRRCDEETLAERWNALSRKKMPTFDADAEEAKADASRPAAPDWDTYKSMRTNRDWWYVEATRLRGELKDARANMERLLEERDALLEACCLAARYLNPDQFPDAVKKIDAAIAAANGGGNG